MTTNKLDLENLRKSYLLHKLDIADCAPVPFDQFESWFSEALKSECDEPNAFVLSTIHDNKPRSRVVLLKGIVNQKLLFYTNYESAKGHELDENPYVSMNFLWLPLQRQVRIEGKISKVDEKLSEEYFQKRPRGSQIGAIASPQSQVMKDRHELENLFRQTEEKFAADTKLSRPRHWGGYQIEPSYFEFWQGRDNRMHDRVCYELKAGGWERFRLAP